MNDQTDAQLLRAYAQSRSEPAFAEIVRRHIDLVHSAALRMVCDAHLAQDVTQNAFVALANNAAQLANRPVLSGLLHRTAQNIAAQTVRTDVRRRQREQEVAVMNELLANAPQAAWQEIAPHLDTAIGELDESDRDALLLRYFEKKSAHEMAGQLGISDDAAQKRVSRAVERLREFFAKRGLTVGASGLTIVISANAVQAAPVGLALTIATTAALTGSTLTTTATVPAAKAIAMTTLQKTIFATTIAILAGVGIYEARQTSRLRSQVQTLQQQQAERVRQSEGERDDATSQLAALRDDNERLNRNSAELLKLRGETGRLQRALRDMQDETTSTKPKGEIAPSSTNQIAGTIFVGGQVQFPGRNHWTQGMRLTDALKAAGMLTSVAGETVTVTDSTGTKRDYNLRHLLSGSTDNPVLQPGDMLFVPTSTTEDQ